jgi:hypothetical protein
MRDAARATDVLAELRAMGVRLAVDDYGTGYSSLAYLHALPVDDVKLDRAFVAHCDSDPRSAAIVKSTVELVHNLGMCMIAEGVENGPRWSSCGSGTAIWSRATTSAARSRRTASSPGCWSGSPRSAGSRRGSRPPPTGDRASLLGFESLVRSASGTGGWRQASGRDCRNVPCGPRRVLR